MDELLNGSMWNLSDYKDVCARTIIMAFYETGMRAAELIGLDDAMVDLEACQLKVTGKRNKQRVIPFGQGLRDALSAYMELRDKVVTRLEPALFVSAKGRRLTYPQVRVCVSDNLARVSSLKNAARTCCAIRLLQPCLIMAPDLRALRSCWGIRS